MTLDDEDAKLFILAPDWGGRLYLDKDREYARMEAKLTSSKMSVT